MSGHLKYLDGWRGIAIIWIVLGHVSSRYSLDASSDAKWFLYSFTQHFRFGLMVFFIVSGFLITGKLLRLGPRLQDLGGFYRNRALRVLPAYFTLLLFVFSFNIVFPDIHYGFEVTRTGPLKVRVAVQQEIEKDRRYEGLSERGTRLFLDVKPVADGYEYTLRYLSGYSVNTVFPKMVKPGSTYTFNLGPMPRSSEHLSNRLPGESVRSYIPYFFLLPNYAFFGKVQMVSHSWFVGTIVQFYLLYGLMMFLAVRLSLDYVKRRRLVFTCLLVSLCVVVGLKAGFHRLLWADAILIGCLLKFLEPLHERTKGSLRNVVFPLVLFSGGAGLIWFVVERLQGSWDTPFRTDPALFSIATFALGMMIAATYPRNAVTRFVFENRPLRWVGRHSYGIFLWHYPLMYIYFITRNYISIDNCLSIFIYFVLSLVVGWGMEKTINSFIPVKKDLPIATLE